MAWRALTETDLKSRLSAGELATYRKLSLVDGNDADPVQAVIDQITGQVRAYISGSPNNQLGADGTIPEILIGSAVSLAVLEVMARAGGSILDLQGHRVKSADQAMSMLKDVARGMVKVDMPMVVTAEKSAFIAPSIIQRRPREFCGWQQDGI